MEKTYHIEPETPDFKNENLLLKNNFVKFYDKRILVLKNKINVFRTTETTNASEKLKLDYLILSGNNYQKVKNLLSYFDFKLLIIDSSNSTWKANKIIKECKELHVNVYSVPQQGAFVSDI